MSFATGLSPGLVAAALVIALLSPLQAAAQSATPQSATTQSATTQGGGGRVAFGKDSSFAQAVVATYGFERREDQDFDTFPDGWTRKRDRQHPPYLAVRIVAHHEQLLEATRWLDRHLLDPWEWARARWPAIGPLPPALADLLNDHYLRLELDGGAATLQGPSLRLDLNYRYQLSGRGMTSGLVYSHAYAELVFLDVLGNPIAIHRSVPQTGTTPWESWQTPLATPPPSAHSMTVRLHLSPISGGLERDIRGAAGFDDLVLVQVPRVRVDTDQRVALYRPDERPVVKMQVMGLRHRTAAARFVLKDSESRVLEVAEKPYVYQGGQYGPIGRDDAFEAVAQWTLPALPPGFYTVESSLTDGNEQWLRGETTLAVLADLPAAAHGNFGWSLPAGAGEVELRRVPEWLRRSGVYAVKYPFWIDPSDRAALDATAWLTERLKENDIRCVGLLTAPPPAIQAVLDERDQRQPVAANLFRDTRVWQPLLEPIMTRMTVRVKTWQLGLDGDHSFLGRPQLAEVLAGINRDLQGFGQPIGVAISWPWLEPLPGEVRTIAAATARWTDEPLTSDELDAYLQMTAAVPQERGKSETWVSLDPLSSKQYDRDSRIRDLLLRMATVRGHAVGGAFITDPHHPTHGLLRPDSRPGELFLPWRTASLLLGDVDRVGEIRLEGEGSNIVFANSRRTVMMLWSPQPSTETIYLGDNVRQVDAWGRSTIPERVESGSHVMHRLQLGPVPTFLVDVDPLVIAVRMSTRLQSDQLDSLLERRQSITLLLSNPTDERLAGSVLLKQPANWRVESPAQSFMLAPRENTSVSFDVILSNIARIGETQLDFDVHLRTEPAKKFTLRRPLHVGPEGLDLQVTTKKVGDELLVQLHLRNLSSGDRQYDCLLFPPGGRQYQRQQVSIPAGATVRREFVWDDAASLIGKSMLLRAVEQGSSRILNQSITVTP